METFGEFLKNQREKKGVRLEEIASITKIHLHTLQFLEESEWEQLPPEPFIRGFIIAYAKYVGLDTHDTLERYALEVGKSKAPPPNELEVISSEFENKKTDVVADVAPLSKKPKTAPADLLNQPPTLPLKKYAIGAGALLLLAIIVGVAVVGKKNSNEPQVATTAIETAPAAPTTPPPQVAQTEPAQPVAPSQPTVKPPTDTVANQIQNAISNQNRGTASEQTAKSETSSTKPVEAQKPVEEAKPVAAEFAHELTVEGKERSWMKIVIDGNPPKEMYTKPGEKSVFQAKEKIKLVVGNAAATTVLHNGEKTDGKKFQGTIHFYVYPKGARFPQDPPKRAVTSKPAEETTLENTSIPPTESTETKPE